MAQPTLQNYLGANCQYLTTGTIGTQTATSGDPVLAIKFSDFAAIGFSTPTNDPDKWLAAIVRNIKAWLVSDASQDPGLSVGEPLKDFVVRNGTSRLSYTYDLSFYIPDNTSSVLDPDDVL